MISNNRPRKEPIRSIISLVFTLFATALLTGIAHAQVGEISFFSKAGDPTEYVAHGSSQQASASNPGILISKVIKPENLGQQGESNESGELLEYEPVVTASGTLSEAMSGALNTTHPMGTTFELKADFATGTISGTLKGSRTSTPGGWMNCFDPADPSTEFDRINVNTTESYVASFSGSIDKETGEFSIAITPTGGTSATKVSLFTHERCLDLNSKKYSGEQGWTGKGTISGGVSKDGGINFSTSWTYSWFKGEVLVNGQWNGTGIATPPREEEVEEGATNEVEPEVSTSDSSPEEEETEDEATSEVEPEVTTLVTSLESFLRSAGLSNIDPARLAAAGTGVSALIAIWMIVNHRAGVPMEKLEQAVGRWRWREGGELPESQSEVEKKTPDKPPEKLPEAEKTDKADKPTSLPEQKDPDDGAKVTTSESFDEPTSDESAAAPPSKAKKPSGETGEERIERAVDDAEGLRDALDKTIADFKKFLEKVPKGTKDGDFWKQKVAPKLKKLDDLKLEEKSGKLKEYLRIAKELLEVRKNLDAKLSNLSKEDRKGVIWITRGLRAGREGLSKLHSQLITDPAIAAFKKTLPKEQAAAVEKFLKQHQSDIEKMLKGIEDLPADGVKNLLKASGRTGNVPDIEKKYYEGFKHNTPTDFGRSLRKLDPVIKKVNAAGAWVKKQLGRVIIDLKDTRPGQK